MPVDLLCVEGVDRADDPFASAHIEHVGIDHGGLDVLVTEQFLDGTDVVAGQKEMGREGVPQGMAARVLGDSRISDSLLDSFLNDRFVEVAPADLVGFRIGAAGTGREDVLPAPIGGGSGEFPIEGVWHMNSTEAVGEILVVKVPNVGELVLQTLPARVGQEGRTVFSSLAVADDDVSEIEIDILDSESKALEDAHPGAIEQQNDELDGSFETGEECRDLFAAEDGGQPFGLAGANDVLDPRRIDLENLTIEEEDGAEGLSLGGGGDVFIDGKMSEKPVDLVGFEIAGMLFVELDEAADPGEIGLFGADGVVADPDRGTYAV